MIVIKVMERDMIVTTTSRITSGSVNLPVKFHFKGDEWDDLVKTAVFIGSGEERDVALITDECAVPADVLAEAGGDLKIGVYGRLANGATVIPTIWGRVQYIYEGTEMGEPSPHDPEPDWTAQVQQAAATALTKAQAVEEAAARGDFDGVSPEVTIDTIAHGHSVTITDEEHPEGQSFPVLDGASAYEQAVAGGYTGTEAQFNQELKSFKSLSEQAAGSATQAAGSATQAAGSASAAAGSETAAAGSASAAAGAASAAAGSASAAEQSAIDAAAAAEATGGSETAAAASATAAAESATAAADSATAAEEHEYDAEAWADGERKGSPVGSTDKTYHNNAKYYAQQAGASATAAGQSVDAAAESATAAASSATAAGNAQTAAEDAQEAAETAQAAAESARDTAITTLQTEGAAQRTAIQQKGAETLASIPEDYTDLSGDVADLKSATINYEFASANFLSEIEQGGITSYGNNSTNIACLRSKGMYPIGKGEMFKIDLTTSFQANIIVIFYGTSVINQGNRISDSGWIAPNTLVTAPDNISYFRFIIKQINDSEITPSDVSAVSVQRLENPKSAKEIDDTAKSVFDFVGGGRGTLSASDFEQGSIGPNGKNVYESLYYSKRLRLTKYIPVPSSGRLKVSIASSKTVKYSCSFFTTNDWTTNRIGSAPWRYNGEIIVVPKTARYCRISLMEADNATIAVSDITSINIALSSLDDFLADGTDNQYRVPFASYPGYIDVSTGGVNAQQTGKLQIYTSKIDIKKYKNICVKVEYEEPQVMWAAIGQYTENDEFIARDTICWSDQDTRELYFDNLIFRDTTRYISVTIYGYGYSNPLSIYASNEDTRCFCNVVAHRGYSEIAPENTASAYRLAKEKGFIYVETDARFTSDGVPVCLHDTTIDRTSNGTGTLSSMTYSQVSQYDFGSWKSSKYAGEKILTFDAFISLCKQLALIPFIELKGSPSDSQCRILVDIVNKYGMLHKVKWFGQYKTDVQKILELDSSAEVGISDETLTSGMITDAVSLKTASNKVFLMANKGITDALAGDCADNGIPLGQWIVDGLGDITIHPYTTILLTNKTQFWSIFTYLGLN